LRVIDDLFNQRGYEDAVLTLKRDVSEGGVRRADRVKLRLESYEVTRAGDGLNNYQAVGVVRSSTVPGYPPGSRVSVTVFENGTSSLRVAGNDSAPEVFNRTKFKGKRERLDNSVRDNDAYLAQEDIRVVHVPPHA
jgi:hypothetical protein